MRGRLFLVFLVLLILILVYHEEYTLEVEEREDKLFYYYKIPD